MRLTVTGASNCIVRIRVTVEQDGSPAQGIDLSFQNGEGTGEFPTPLQPNQDVRVTVRAVLIRQSPECENFSLDDAFVFSGRLQSNGDQSYTVPYSEFVRVRHRFRPDTPAEPALMFLWAVEAPHCSRICWQQWVNTRLFWRDQNGNWREIAIGTQFRDAFKNRQVFGQFGRDLPSAPDHCFRQDPIPGETNANGIVDRPNLPAAGGLQLLPAAQASIQALTGAQPPFPIQLQYRFDVRSILWCDAPPPAHILGYYSWQATEELIFQAQTVGNIASYSFAGPAQWTTGTGGLNPEMLDH